MFPEVVDFFFFPQFNGHSILKIQKAYRIIYYNKGIFYAFSLSAVKVSHGHTDLLLNSNRSP